jgi:probable HAF family extracellular repeat protein
MKSNALVCAAIALLAVIAAPARMTAQNGEVQPGKHHHYQLVQIPTLGGPGTYFVDAANNIAVLNNRGSVSGGSADTLIPDPFSPAYWWSNGNVTKAYLWQNGSLTQLGSLLDNVNSLSTWISSNDLVAGISENGQIDPSVPDLPEMSAVLWRDGKITSLGTLPGGGYQSAAVSVNNRGKVVGVATNLVPDANSLLQFNQNIWAIPYPYQLRAFIWDQKNGMQDLGTLGSGTNAEALAINERGQIVGDSYTSSAPGACYGVTSGAFIWDRKHGMVDLGNFGGTCTVPGGLNNRGQVVGASLVTGDVNQRAFLWEHGSLRDLGGFEGNITGAYAINERGEAVGYAQHAALWKKVGELIDLGTVGSDPCSFAQGINDEDQVVGNSSPSDCVNFNTSRGFLWENGSIADLNTLIPSTSPLYVIYAYTINRRGEIAVNGIDANGIEQAAVLIPCDENHQDVEGCDYSLVDTGAATQSPTPSYRANRGSHPPQSRWLNRRHFPGPMGMIGTASEATEAKPLSRNSRESMTNDLLEPAQTRRANAYCSAAGGVLTGWCSAPQSLHCVAKKVPAPVSCWAESHLTGPVSVRSLRAWRP